jgi:ABC-type cobalamin/Fe3+-siderophores transport system ATPase subunit
MVLLRLFLRDCTLEIPAGAVAALVGPNGAGKTTLLEMIIGLLEPTEGRVSVLGEASRADTAQTLARVGYVAQDHPLYRDFSVADMFHLGQAMNPSWDQELAAARMDTLGIPLKRKVKSLSGGQQAQVSLTMALAKRAPLVVLDEPVSSLDPIARLEFMRDVMASAADADLTFLISSHVVSELAVITWYRAPMDRLTGHLQHNSYDFEGLVLTAYILSAFGFAVLAGLLLRRSIPAMVTAFIPWLAIRLVIEFVFRPHFMTPLTVQGNCGPPNGCGQGLGFVPQATGRIGDLVLNINGNTITYQPADRFWPFQFIEAGIFVALTAAALGATIWLLHRRATWTA